MRIVMVKTSLMEIPTDPQGPPFYAWCWTEEPHGWHLHWVTRPGMPLDEAILFVPTGTATTWELDRIASDLNTPGRPRELMLRKLGLRTNSANALSSRS